MLIIFLVIELGNYQYSRVDRKTNITRHEGVCGELRGQNLRCHPAVGVSNRGRQCAKSNYRDVKMNWTRDGLFYQL